VLMYMGSGAALAAYLRRTRVEALDQCATACAATSRHCLQLARAGGADSARLVFASRLTTDCGQVCALAAGLMVRGTPLAHHALLACALSCRRCVEACLPLSTDHVIAECLRLCHESESACLRTVGDKVA